jgi:AcrR family transcriptional regulator
MRTNERRTALKEALVDAAEGVIASRGLSHLRARELAQEVGCAVGAIYNVFPDLDSLILAVNLRTLALFDAEVAEALGAGRDPRPSGPEAAVEALVQLSAAYLAFAERNGPRWRALFQHRMAEDAPPPDWYLAEQVRLFRYIEDPLRVLCPRLSPEECQLLARTLFSATHGMVSLGLDEKLVSVPPALLRRQVETVVRATGEGLAAECRA